MSHLKIAKRVFDIESKAVSNLAEVLDKNFTQTIDAILASKGRVIVCGMGKSGIIGKIIPIPVISRTTVKKMIVIAYFLFILRLSSTIQHFYVTIACDPISLSKCN